MGFNAKEDETVEYLGHMADVAGMVGVVVVAVVLKNRYGGEECGGEEWWWWGEVKVVGVALSCQAARCKASKA